jgi:hypothetical protein
MKIVLMIGISALMKVPPQSRLVLLPCEDTARKCSL